MSIDEGPPDLEMPPSTQDQNTLAGAACAGTSDSVMKFWRSSLRARLPDTPRLDLVLFHGPVRVRVHHGSGGMV